MNHIVYITGGCDTTPNPEYPLGQKVTPDASDGLISMGVRKYQSCFNLHLSKTEALLRLFKVWYTISKDC
ncbi:conserved hypothetical protein [Trichinella spiralis]|uniref:hypothetical protein n=1 Tax=Trichinella spiralis TaxID=6334 RepID=UPI0001EFEA92|nr:conserved hypothetical protein [Trichinella spiralis]